METRYHIGLLTGTLLILAILSYAYYADYNYRKEIARTEQTEQQETEQTVSTQGGAHKEGVYYLKNRNGYVIVYLDDQTSIYEYTNTISVCQIAALVQLCTQQNRSRSENPLCA